MSVADADKFWSYSCATYGKPGVQAACLALQERLGADTNLLLFCLWWSFAGGAAFERTHFAEVVKQAGAWQDAVVRPLRAARRAAKPGAGTTEDQEAATFYRRVLATELEAERMEQRLILAAVVAQAPRPALPALTSEAVLQVHLSQYLATLGVPALQEDRAHLETIIAAGAPMLPAAEVVATAWR